MSILATFMCDLKVEFKFQVLHYTDLIEKRRDKTDGKMSPWICELMLPMVNGTLSKVVADQGHFRNLRRGVCMDEVMNRVISNIIDEQSTDQGSRIWHSNHVE